MNPVIFALLVLLGLAFAATAIFSIRVRRELRAWRLEQRQKEIALGAEVHEVRAKLQALSAKLEEPAATPKPRSTPQVRSGINMTKRIQAIRLMRRGETPARIAAALGMSRREVEILIRVHQMAVHRAAQTAGAG